VQETISLIVLIEFPLELFFAVFAGRWATRGRPFSPWLLGYHLRLAMALVSTCLVALFPVGATLQSSPLSYLAVVSAGVTTSFASTIMFVSQVKLRGFCSACPLPSLPGVG
jgi:PAT family acetyl-CoA transporter-like MFS transporter 1